MIDNPRVRASFVCPLCLANKNPGLVTCWPCYRVYDLKNGNPAQEHVISQAEAVLAKVFA